jgi:outer membrane protein TolC
MFFRLFNITLVAAVVVFTGGCAIQPTPMTDADRQQRIDTDLEQMFTEQEPLQGPLTLHEALARALKYNLDRRVKLMEEALARSAAHASKLDMLPQLTASAGYHDRNNDSGASSESLLSGVQSLEPSTSQQREYSTSSLGVAWNILDFGVSYYTAKQESDRVLVTQELKRKVVQNIVVDVQSAWWRALVAQQLGKEILEVREEARNALARSKQLQERFISNPLEQLKHQKTLLDLLNKLSQTYKEMSKAKVELATLINLKPGTDYDIAIPESELLPKLPDMSLHEMETMALSQRPELREEDYKQRIDALEVRKAVARMFPGLEIQFSREHNSNDYLYNNTWSQIGVQLSWNIFNLFTGQAAREHAEVRVQFDNMRRMALSMAVLTQTHLAMRKYEEALADYNIARQLKDVEDKILKHVKAQISASRSSEQERIATRTSALRSRLRSGLAYAQLQTAVARIYHSLGVDLMPDTIQGSDLQSVASALEQHLRRVYNGTYQHTAKPVNNQP